MKNRSEYRKVLDLILAARDNNKRSLTGAAALTIVILAVQAEKIAKLLLELESEDEKNKKIKRKKILLLSFFICFRQVL